MHILIVEDERQIAENLYEYLEQRGHQCDYAETLRQAERLLAAGGVDALLLDRNLPDGDGLQLVRRLRAEGSGIAVLALTARDTLDDKLLGFDAGVDDYLVKPFALQEVEVRLLALSRRSGKRADAGSFRLGGLVYDATAQEARLDGVPLRLPPKALRLVATLIQQPNRVFSRRELEVAVWGHEQDSSDNLRSVLHTARKAFGDGSAGIENVHGLGYKLAARGVRA